MCYYCNFLFAVLQDCLWSPKCIRQGWFLTYGPSEKEYGAWKKHYVACACTLDFLSPWEAADIYGTLNETLPEAEEEEQKRTECLIRQTICERIVEHKSKLKAFLIIITFPDKVKHKIQCFIFFAFIK